VAPGAFGECGGVVSFAGSGGTALREICYGAFMGCRSLRSLSPAQPPRVKIGPCAFALCDSLPDLRFLPFSADVSELAFGRAEIGGEDTQGRLLALKAAALGFLSVGAWARDRRLVPARRYAVYSCVAAARGQEGRRRGRSAVEPLLARIAGLPNELVREVVGFVAGDHLLSDFVVAAAAADDETPITMTLDQLRASADELGEELGAFAPAFGEMVGDPQFAASPSGQARINEIGARINVIRAEIARVTAQAAAMMRVHVSESRRRERLREAVRQLTTAATANGL
jgi:hypothetical protein